MGDIHIDPIFLDAKTIAVSGSFPFIPNDKGKKKVAKGTYKLVVKDGDTKYDYVNGNYNAKTIDYVQESDNLADGLISFLEWIGDSENDSKVSLVFVPAKKGKDKK